MKDYTLLEGSATKRTARIRPGAEVVLFALRLARMQGLSDRQALDSEWFRFLGISRDGVQDLLYAANRAGDLQFRMQADVVELILPPLPEL